MLKSLKNNIAYVCMVFGLLAAAVVLFSWVYGYWSNGMYGTKFEINSCWQGISACGVGLIGLFKWLVDSTKNSPVGKFPDIVPAYPVRPRRTKNRRDVEF